MLFTGPVEFRSRTDEEIRHAAKKHEMLSACGLLTKKEIEEMMSGCGVKLPSEFSRLPYWDEACDYLIDLMHLIKNLGEHVCDSLMGADFDAKVRDWAEQQGIKQDWWATGRPRVCPGASARDVYALQVRARYDCTNPGYSSGA